MGRRLQLRLDIERYRKVSACAQQRGTSVAAVIGRPLTAVSVVPTTGRAAAVRPRSGREADAGPECTGAAGGARGRTGSPGVIVLDPTVLV